MIRYLFVDVLVPLLLFFLLRAALRNLFGVGRPSTPQRAPSPAPPTVQPGGELKKDPVCGTYVSAAASLTRTVGGQVLYFCSKECRDKYRVA
jgi:YHS domain-containing protein